MMKQVPMATEASNSEVKSVSVQAVTLDEARAALRDKTKNSMPRFIKHRGVTYDLTIPHDQKIVRALLTAHTPGAFGRQQEPSRFTKAFRNQQERVKERRLAKLARKRNR